ncbi:MAG: DUF1501 domain-containing protein, partial [Verrucomicrobiota bacterium]
MSPLTRREVLRRCSLGFGGVALSGLLASPAYGASGAPARPGKARNVIFCYMSGGVSHVDSFDPKPELNRLHGKPMPVPIQRTVFYNNGNIMASPGEARPRGKSGIMMTDLFPQIASLADDLTVVRSMTSKVSEHAQGNYFFHTGFPFMGHPSAGAWMTYGLGSENQNLPGFVVLQSGGAVVPHGGVGLFSNGYLPGQHQASIIKADAQAPLDNIRPSQADAAQRRRLAFIGEVDRAVAEASRDPQVEAALRNYETAYRMQSAVPEACDISGESESTKAMYGLDSADKLTAGYARQALLARRLVERGVRFVELSCISSGIGAGNGPNPWDQHGPVPLLDGAMLVPGVGSVARPDAGGDAAELDEAHAAFDQTAGQQGLA